MGEAILTSSLNEKGASAKKGFGAAKTFLMVIIFGIIGTVAPWGSIYVATFKGITDLSRFNSSMLMILSLLVLVLLIIEATSALYNNKVKMLLLCILFAILSLSSFLYNMIIFVTI